GSGSGKPQSLSPCAGAWRSRQLAGRRENSGRVAALTRACVRSGGIQQRRGDWLRISSAGDCLDAIPLRMADHVCGDGRAGLCMTYDLVDRVPSAGTPSLDDSEGARTDPMLETATAARVSDSVAF